MRSRNWINAKGEVIKTISLSGPSMSTFWAPAEVARRTKDEFELEDLLQRTATLAGSAQVPDNAQQVVYTVDRNAAASAGDLFSMLARSKHQGVLSTSALSAEVTVVAASIDANQSGLAGSSELPPDESCLAASTLLPCDQASLKELANQLKGDAATPSQVALRLTSRLHTALTEVPMDRELNATLQVAHKSEGDSAEQAMLLTTLLRSQQIPARVASGLRVMPQDPTRMAFHMWTEAWLDDRWLPLDATEGGIAGIDRIKMLDSSLQGENPYGALLPVFRQINSLDIKVKDYL